jgi:cold-inducible RNA-binding protein
MKIYVGNMSYETSEDDLRKVFEAHGQVTSVAVISDQYTGRSKGFGFVEMSNETEAKAAMEGLNGSDMDGRTLKVNEARPRNEGQRGGNRGGYNHRY